MNKSRFHRLINVSDKKQDNTEILLGIGIIVFPFLAHADKMIWDLSATIVLLVFAFGIFFIRFWTVKKMIVRLPDILVVVYGLYSGIRGYLENADLLFGYKIAGYIFLYFLIRQIRFSVRIFYFILLSGFLQTIIGVAQQTDVYFRKPLFYGMTGSFFNSGPYGIYMAFCCLIWLGLTVRKQWRLPYSHRWIKSVTGILLFYGLCMSFSRTAWLMVIAGSIALWALTFTDQAQRRRKKRFPFRSFGLAGIVLLCGWLLYLWRLDSANGRLLIWRVAVDMFKAHPLKGAGINTFCENYMYYQADYLSHLSPEENFIRVAGNNDLAFNEGIRLACEQGLIGLLILGSVFIVLWKGRQTVSPGKGLWEMLLAGAFVAMNFSYPFQVQTLLVLMIVLGGLYVNVGNFRICACWKKTKIFSLLLLLIAGWGIGEVKYRYCTFRQIERVFAEQLHKRGVKNPEELEPYSTVFKENRNCMTVYWRLLYEARHYEKAVEAGLHCVKLQPSSDNFYTLGNCYLSLRDYRQALPIIRGFAPLNLKQRFFLILIVNMISIIHIIVDGEMMVYLMENIVYSLITFIMLKVLMKSCWKSIINWENDGMIRTIR